VAIITQRKKDVISGVTFVDQAGSTWKGSEVGASARQLGNAGMLDASEADYKKHNERARTWQASARDPEPAPEEEEVSHASPTFRPTRSNRYEQTSIAFQGTTTLSR
jgi:hypothetical protein